MRANLPDERAQVGNLTFIPGYHHDPKTFSLLALFAHQFGFIDVVGVEERIPKPSG